MARQVQHWVPRFLIRNFSDTDGRVFKLDKRTDEITKISPKVAAASVGFYEFTIQGKQFSFEKSFEKIETLAAPIFKKIIKERSTHALSPTQRIHVANFIAAQSIRTEAFRRGYDRQLNEKQFGPIFDLLWRSMDWQRDQLLRRKWLVMTIDGNERFLLGDQPVALQCTEDPKKDIALGFDVPGVEVFIPISPKCALYLPCATRSGPSCLNSFPGFLSEVSAFG